MRNWLAYRLMRWAVALDVDLTVRMAMVLVTEHTKRMMQERGISHFSPVHNEDGEVVGMEPVGITEPTIH
jgi:hypothetical protein